jgi:hypothetical protein
METHQCGCTLNGDDLAERVQAWREVSSRATSRRIHGDRISSIYPSEPELVHRLRDLIDAEGACCSFLSFTVTEGPAETIVELTFPAEARALVEGIIPAPSPT